MSVQRPILKSAKHIRAEGARDMRSDLERMSQGAIEAIEADVTQQLRYGSLAEPPVAFRMSTGTLPNGQLCRFAALVMVYPVEKEPKIPEHVATVVRETIKIHQKGQQSNG